MHILSLIDKSVMTEKEISAGCQRADARAREMLYTRYSGRLLATAMRYMGSREEAEDVLHDAFITAYRSFDKFEYRGEGSLAAWLQRIVVNRSLDALRIRQKSILEPLDGDADEPEVDADDVDTIPRDELLRLVASLPDGYRTVINMYAFDGLSHKEIAERLGISEKTSSSQFFRAKKLLAKMINDYLTKTER